MTLTSISLSFYSYYSAYNACVWSNHRQRWSMHPSPVTFHKQHCGGYETNDNRESWLHMIHHTQKWSMYLSPVTLQRAVSSVCEAVLHLCMHMEIPQSDMESASLSCHTQHYHTHNACACRYHNEIPQLSVNPPLVTEPRSALLWSQYAKVHVNQTREAGYYPGFFCGMCLTPSLCTLHLQSVNSH